MTRHERAVRRWKNHFTILRGSHFVRAARDNERRDGCAIGTWASLIFAPSPKVARNRDYYLHECMHIALRLLARMPRRTKREEKVYERAEEEFIRNICFVWKKARD